MAKTEFQKKESFKEFLSSPYTPAAMVIGVFSLLTIGGSVVDYFFS